MELRSLLLPGGQNLGELSDIEYFQKKLYRALGVPESRIAADGGFNLGRSSEILRDELKFAKFVGRFEKAFLSTVQRYAQDSTDSEECNYSSGLGRDG